MAGRLVVFEGIDGAGTETQSKLLLDYLKGRGVPAERIRYPDYDQPIGRLIHEYLHKKFDFPTEVQVMLYAADFIKDAKKLRQWLNEGRVVIADRYITSTAAYQGFRFPVEKITGLAEMFGLPKPDIVLYLNVSAGTSIRRKMKEKKHLDRNEADREFLEKLSGFYMNLAKKETLGRWVVIDGERTKEEVFEDVKQALEL
jgi:dTMP kinase